MWILLLDRELRDFLFITKTIVLHIPVYVMIYVDT